jgi:muconolactone delta-isomerase
MWGTDNFVSVPQISYYDEWVSLGVFATNANGQLNVTLSDLTMEGYLETKIGFDAIKVIPAFDSYAQSKSECSLNGW